MNLLELKNKLTEKSKRLYVTPKEYNNLRSSIEVKINETGELSYHFMVSGPALWLGANKETYSFKAYKQQMLFDMIQDKINSRKYNDVQI
ncbi:MAG: hypothetical protein WBG71_04360 [Leeuwenhoekiella sp.]